MWPRGVRKDKAAFDAWLRDIAPSAALRTWYGKDVARWDAFCARYARELDAKPDAVAALRTRAKAGTVTLLFAKADPDHNNAVALKRYLLDRR